jgi:DNA-directed RNA polymerase specialized sigma24 family protein
MMDVGPARLEQIGRAADPEGFTDFVAARSPALLRMAWFLTGDETRAEDLVQESLAKAWRHWCGVEPRS